MSRRPSRLSQVAMPRLLLIAHAPLATALKSVASHVFPECLGDLVAIDVPPDWAAEQVEVALRAAMPADQEGLILTDVFGATPCNVALRLADGVAWRVVSGVNVPMLWRTWAYRSEPLDSLVSRAVAGGTQGVMPVSTPRPQNQSQDPSLAHAASQAHHQQ